MRATRRRSRERAHRLTGERDSLPLVDRIYGIALAKVYPLYIEKVQRKGRSKADVDAVIQWLTGFDEAQVREHIEGGSTLQEFFAGPVNPSASLITGVICGVRVEQIEDPLVQKIRYLDKLIDEVAKGKPLGKVLRGPVGAPVR